ncbi:uncharacterized protein LOC120073824 [Benincasa hispida]|uniref:uncharacterized protein LOC120073824 n=1 Tax=Benincasa hispida TaxID=102211 RepID=UPI0018FF770E|nr:uncharacterized protein LOC120073824 [Benincasa hispida]
MADKKPTVMSEIVPMVSKVIEHKLNGSNYSSWRSNVRHFIRSMEMDDHITEESPIDANKKIWWRDDSRMLLQIKNSIDREIVELVNHCESVKKLLEYLDFLYSGKENINRVFDVCKTLYQPDQGEKSLTSYFMEVKNTCAEFNALMPISTDPKVLMARCEKLFIMSFLVGLAPKYEMAKDQMLSSLNILSLEEAYTRILRTEKTQAVTSFDSSSTLIGRTNDYRGNKGVELNSSKGHPNNQRSNPGSFVCYYRHTKRECRRLLNKGQRMPSPFAHVASTPDNLDKSITISAEEFAKF